MSDKLLLDDVRFYGPHAARPAGERGSWFAVDAELSLDLRPAAVCHDLGAAELVRTR